MNEAKHQPAIYGRGWRVLVTQNNGHQWSRVFSCREFSFGADHYARVVNETTGWKTEVVKEGLKS